MGFESLSESIKFLIIAFVFIVIVLLLTKWLWGERLKYFSFRLSPKDIGLDIEIQSIGELIRQNTIYSKDIGIPAKEAPFNPLKNIGASRISQDAKRVVNIFLSANSHTINPIYFGLETQTDEILFPSVKSISLLSGISKIPVDIFISFKKTITVQCNESVNFQSIFVIFLKLPETPQKNPSGLSAKEAKLIDDFLTSEVYSKRWHPVRQKLNLMLPLVGELQSKLAEKSIFWIIVMGKISNSSHELRNEN